MTSFARWAMVLAAVVYACLSSPTPDAPGYTEAIIVFLLISALVPWRLPRGAWVGPFAILLAYGFMIPVAGGVLSGNGAGDMARDIMAFCALGLPLAYTHLYQEDDRRVQTMLLGMLLIIGLVFSARYLAQSTTLEGAFAALLRDHDLLYLANSPLVAFAATWLLLQGCFVERRWYAAFFLVLLSLLPLAAMIGMAQRATIALLALAWVAFFVRSAAVAPRRAVIIGLGALCLLVVSWPLPVLLVDALRDKTYMVGWNARGAELAALMESIKSSPLTAVFGSGWGSLFRSPAVGNEWVRFSHALLTSLMWKAGFMGLILAVAALVSLGISAVNRLRHDAVSATALILPLLPAIFLYGSYKSFCFGLLLLGLSALNWTGASRGGNQARFT